MPVLFVFRLCPFRLRFSFFVFTLLTVRGKRYLLFELDDDVGEHTPDNCISSSHTIKVSIVFAQNFGGSLVYLKLTIDRIVMKMEIASSADRFEYCPTWNWEFTVRTISSSLISREYLDPPGWGFC